MYKIRPQYIIILVCLLSLLGLKDVYRFCR
jgi:hypothetical protein